MGHILPLHVGHIQADVAREHPDLPSALRRNARSIVSAEIAEENRVAAWAVLSVLRSTAKRIARPILFAAIELWRETHAGATPTGDINTHLRALGYPQYIVLKRARSP